MLPGTRRTASANARSAGIYNCGDARLPSRTLVYAHKVDPVLTTTLSSRSV